MTFPPASLLQAEREKIRQREQEEKEKLEQEKKEDDFGVEILYPDNLKEEKKKKENNNFFNSENREDAVCLSCTCNIF